MQSEPSKILRRLQQFVYKSAIIAGGAVRDDYMGRPITDYDIFLWDPRRSSEFNTIHNLNPSNPQLDFDPASFEMEQTSWFMALLETDVVEQIYKEGGYNAPVAPADADTPSAPGIAAQLTSIWQAEKNFETYQLIYTHINPIQHVERFFDIGLCKAYCDGEKIRYTPHFFKDVQDKTFTIVAESMNQDQFDYAINHHIPKLEQKYPGFKLAVAPHNQHLLAGYKKP